MVVDPIRVVVADDSPVRAVVAEALRGAGIRVVGETADGLAALELVRTHHPQVALVGDRLPGMHGAAIATAVRREGLPTRVLLLSADTDRRVADTAAEEGVAGSLSRRATRADIVETVLICSDGAGVWTRHVHD